MLSFAAYGHLFVFLLIFKILSSLIFDNDEGFLDFSTHSMSLIRVNLCA